MTNKLTNIITSIATSGVLFISGCSGFTLGGVQPTDRSNSRYSTVYEKKADETPLTEQNAFELVDCYGSIKRFDKMDNVVEKTTQKDLGRGMDCGNLADKYNQFWKRGN